MNKREFVEQLKEKHATEITPEDCAFYYKYFHNIDEATRRKILGPTTCDNMGKAWAVYYNNAIEQFISTPYALIPLPNGMCLKAQQNWRNPLREKQRREVPDNMSPGECKKLKNLNLTPTPKKKIRRMTEEDRPRHIKSVVA